MKFNQQRRRVAVMCASMCGPWYGILDNPAEERTTSVRVCTLRFVLIMLFVVAFCGPVAAQAESLAETVQNEQCINCHVKPHQQPFVKIDSGSHVDRHITCTECHAVDPDNPSTKVHEHTGSVVSFRSDGPFNAEKQNAVCLSCHDDSQRMHWQDSAHAGVDLACADCHTVHGADLVLDPATETPVCYRCHAEVRGKMLMPYSHPVREGRMSCSDCHQAHGGAGSGQLTGLSTTESCTECHAEKRGPFLWEHDPVSEDCTLCHDPHGAIHAGMLTQAQPQLCQLCHQPSGKFAAQHARRALDYWAPNESEHVNRLVLGQSCVNCHSQLHGSNHPSGAGLMR